MVERFSDSEMDRTKSSWIARLYNELGKRHTTARALHYFALKKKQPDYPICGSIVGEIRVSRPYDESDGDRISKWILRAKQLGYIPWDSVSVEEPQALVFDKSMYPWVSCTYPIEGRSSTSPKPPISTSDSSYRVKSDFADDHMIFCNDNYRVELWTDKASIKDLVLPLMLRENITLVIMQGDVPWQEVFNLCRRADVWGETKVFCLTDLDVPGVRFCHELFSRIETLCKESFYDKPKISMHRIGIKPDDVRALSLPQVKRRRSDGNDLERYRRYVKAYGLDDRMETELDALEIYHKDGIAGYIEERLREFISGEAIENVYPAETKS